MFTNTLERFKDRKVKAADIFELRQIDKTQAYDFVRQYHYLGDAKFFSQYAFGLFLKEDDSLIGVSTFSPPQGISALKGWFGLPNSDTSVLELTRLCMLPEWNGTNATSYLLSHSIRLLKHKNIRAIVTLADSTRHVGSIYQVCNFKYYGMTDIKSDFYCADGRVNPRGRVSDVRGVWIPRNRKHRYAYILDPTLQIKYKEQPRPTIDKKTKSICCRDTKVVTDWRFNDHYTCPLCTGKLIQISEIEWLNCLMKDA